MVSRYLETGPSLPNGEEAITAGSLTKLRIQRFRGIVCHCSLGDLRLVLERCPDRLKVRPIFPLSSESIASPGSSLRDRIRVLCNRHNPALRPWPSGSHGECINPSPRGRAMNTMVDQFEYLDRSYVSWHCELDPVRSFADISEKDSKETEKIPEFEGRPGYWTKKNIGHVGTLFASSIGTCKTDWVINAKKISIP